MVDTVSRTEQAMRALLGVIDNVTAPAGFPRPSRNEALLGVLDNLGDGDGGRINILDGEQTSRDDMAGADSGQVPNGYDIRHEAQIEFIVLFKDPDRRDATFDAILVAMHDAIAADRTLGGVVDWCEFDIIQRSNTAADGLPNIKACVVSVPMSFTSSRPF